MTTNTHTEAATIIREFAGITSDQPKPVQTEMTQKEAFQIVAGEFASLLDNWDDTPRQIRTLKMEEMLAALEVGKHFPQ
jgi:hypothetical protein